VPENGAVEWSALTLRKLIHGQLRIASIAILRAWDHQFAYDSETLRYTIRSVDFQRIGQTLPRQSADAFFNGFVAHEKVVGAELNDYVTMLFEAAR
jgi:hypothetical protein